MTVQNVRADAEAVGTFNLGGDLRVNRFDLAWLLWCSPSMLPIPGTFSVVHLGESVAAASLKLDEEEIATLAG